MPPRHEGTKEHKGLKKNEDGGRRSEVRRAKNKAEGRTTKARGHEGTRRFLKKNEDGGRRSEVGRAKNKAEGRTTKARRHEGKFNASLRLKTRRDYDF